MSGNQTRMASRKRKRDDGYYNDTTDNNNNTVVPRATKVQKKLLFAGTQILLLDRGVGKVQLGILKNHVVTQGGHLNTSLSPQTTHIVTSLPYEAALRTLNLDHVPDGISLHSVDWITESLRQGVQLSPHEFVLRSPLSITAATTTTTTTATARKSFQSLRKESRLAQQHSGTSSSSSSSSSPLRAPSNNTNNNAQQQGRSEQASPSSSMLNCTSNTLDEAQVDGASTQWLRYDTSSGSEAEESQSSDTHLRHSTTVSPPPVPQQHNAITAPVINPSPYLLKQRPNFVCQKQIQNGKQQNNTKHKKRVAFQLNGERVELSDHASNNHGSKEEDDHPNKEITDILGKLEAQCRGTGDKWRAFAYRKAINVLKVCKKKINTVEDARNLTGIGDRIAAKIEEIIRTGRLRKAEHTDEMTETLTVFLNVWGVGPETAKKWYAAGIRSYNDLRNCPEKVKLTRQQQIGLKYVDEFQQRIPRKEVEELVAIVQAAASTIHPSLHVEACGSYRRGKALCGDLDCLVTSFEDSVTMHGVLARLVHKLHQGIPAFLTDDLVSVTNSKSALPGSSNDNKYMGVCRLSCAGSLHRRIDIQAVPKDEWACALLYFTGSGHFNRSMRLWARKNGMSLSEHALVRRFTEDCTGSPIPVRTEEDVFRALGLDYRPPEERDV